ATPCAFKGPEAWTATSAVSVTCPCASGAIAPGPGFPVTCDPVAGGPTLVTVAGVVTTTSHKLGGCGKVYQVKSKKDGEHYAIKEIALKAGKTFREVDILKSIDNINVVKYFDSWCEKGIPADKIYIQMELCGWNNEFYNLRKVNKFKSDTFVRKQDAELCQVEYFITLTLLEEVLEGVNYLQSLTPPIIHRDLKPQNILVKCAGSKWLKIGDFGLAKIQSSASQSNTKDRGARNYRAPEVMMGSTRN
ncbi:unnamed protein product, partial [Oppiella nova]